MRVFCAARVKLNSSKTAITDSMCFVSLRAIVLLPVLLDEVWMGGTIWPVCAFVHFRGDSEDHPSASNIPGTSGKQSVQVPVRSVGDKGYPSQHAILVRRKRTSPG